MMRLVFFIEYLISRAKQNAYVSLPHIYTYKAKGRERGGDT